MNKFDILSKIDVGNRFRQFRKSLNKKQHELASELEVYQSTIANIERGITFPKINYLHYVCNQYGLNINWLLFKQGEMFIKEYKKDKKISYIMEPHVPYGDPKYEKYFELLELMQIPAIEHVIFTKLIELKVLLKDEIKEFYSKKDINR